MASSLCILLQEPFRLTKLVLSRPKASPIGLISLSDRVACMTRGSEVIHVHWQSLSQAVQLIWLHIPVDWQGMNRHSKALVC